MRTAAMVGTVLAIVGASLSPAAALPVGAGPTASPEGSPLLLQVEVGQHLKYPGSNSAAAKAARAKRNAPNYVCDKRPALCQ